MASPLLKSIRLRRLRAVIYRFLCRTCVTYQGSGHTLLYADSLLDHCEIELQGKNNTLEIASGCRLWDVKIHLIGENLHCRIGVNCRLRGGQYQLEDRGSRLEIGDHCTIFTPMISAMEGSSVRFGQDCLLAYGCDIRNSDAHSILNANTRERINPAADIVLGDHVWVGNGAQILKGVSIGPRAIVAARTVVTKDVPSGVLVAGVPAHVLRENIDWDHRRL
jgi:acetyltransferase-like isoleucine patch superfamily enzyme